MYLFFLLSILSRSDFEVDGLTYHIIDETNNEVQVVNCSLSTKILTIPGIVKNDEKEFKVTSISTKAFSGVDIKQFETLYLPYTLTNIESSAFFQFKNINMIGYVNSDGEYINNTLPPQLTKINSYVFSQIENLKKLDLNKVIEIGKYAFENSIRLEDIKLNVVEIIGAYSLASIQLLQTIELPETLKEINDFSFSKSTLKTVTGNVPNLERIINSFIYCYDLVSIPELPGIIEFGNQAFGSCYQLKEVHCGSKLESIYSSAFINCKALETFTTDGSKDVFVSPEAFLGCISLKYFDFSCATEILNNAFEECYSLNYIDMSKCEMDHLYPIFESCEIEKLILSPKLESIDSNSFLECNVHSIEFTGTVNTLDLSRAFYDFESELYEVIFAPDCSVNFFAAFVNCPYLSKVVLPKTSFDLDQTFVLCTNLTVVENIGYCTKLNYTFNHCSSLKQLDSMDSLTILGNESFSHCGSLETLPSFPSLTLIGSECFLDCLNLSSFVCGDKLIEIGPSAFKGCINLKKVQFKHSPLLISNNAFLSCNSLESVIVEESSVESNSIHIDDHAFENCSSLRNFEFDKLPINRIGKFAFYNCPLSKTITFIGNPSAVSELNISSFAFFSSEIHSVDFRFDYTSLNLENDSFSGCHNINCVMIDKKHKDDVSSYFNKKFINGVHCSNFFKVNLVYIILVIGGSIILLAILLITIICIVKRRRKKKEILAQPLLTTQQNQYQ